MNAVLIDPPAWFLERRREMDADRWDEVWEGVLHMAPQPTYDHQGISGDLRTILATYGRSRNWHARNETSLYENDDNYRVPDVMLVDPKHASKRGVERRAELVVEILSPNDESRAKLPFYAKCGVPEIWLIDPDTRAIEIYTLRGGTYFAIASEVDGTSRSPVTGITFATIDGPKLRVGSEEI